MCLGRYPEGPTFQGGWKPHIYKRAEKSLKRLSSGQLPHWLVASRANFSSSTHVSQNMRGPPEGSWSKVFEIWTLTFVEDHSGVAGAGRGGVQLSLVAASSRPFPQLHTRQCQTHEASDQHRLFWVRISARWAQISDNLDTDKDGMV